MTGHISVVVNCSHITSEVGINNAHRVVTAKNHGRVRIAKSEQSFSHLLPLDLQP